MNEVSQIFPFLVFVFGMFAQAFYMLWGRWEKGDGKKTLLAFTLGLAGMLPGKNEKEYSIPLHLFLSCMLAAFAFVQQFRKKLLVRIDGQILLAWNVIFLAVLFSRLDIVAWWPLFAIIVLPTAMTIINGFSDIDRTFMWQVFFYVWFTVIIVAVGLFHFAFDTLKVFWGTIPPETSLFNLIFAGASFLYILVNAWYALYIVPLPGKHQSFANRMQEVRAHMQLLAHGYLWKKDNIVANVALVIVLPFFFALNYFYQFADESFFVSLALVVTALISGNRKVESDDGVGVPV